MATAIVALGAREHTGHGPVEIALTIIGALLYVVTLLATVRRRMAPGTQATLSFVTGSGGLAALAPDVPTALLTAAALAGWVVIAGGGWLARPRTGALPGGALLATVATQAVVVAAAAELARWPGAAARDLVVWGGSALWILGVALYATLIPGVLRGLRRRQCPAGDDWVAMGALASSALAASMLSEAMRRPGASRETATVAADLAAVCWLGATAWLAPLLWRERHGLLARVPLRYGFDRWSTVFPLGMYSVSAAAVARALGDAWPLSAVSACAFAVALAAWVAVVAGGLRATFARGRRGDDVKRG